MSELPEPSSVSHSLEMVGLPCLMQKTSGRPDIVIGLLDGPIAEGHDFLNSKQIRHAGINAPSPTDAWGTARRHATFIAAILSGLRNTRAPAICPDCSLIVYPIFSDRCDDDPSRRSLPSAEPDDLARAIVESVDIGARLINLSSALIDVAGRRQNVLDAALNYAMKRDVLIVAAAGNQGNIGSSHITAHPSVIPVVSYGQDRAPSSLSNFGAAIGKRGLGAPGEQVGSLNPDGQFEFSDGTSVATPFVTGAIALLWSMFPSASAAEIRIALTSHCRPRNRIIPPMLDAWTSYLALGGRHAT